jgi:DNA-binding PadR family transcriptional regulator
MLLETMLKHETLTAVDIAKEENLGIVPNPGQLKYLLAQLTKSGLLTVLHGANPLTYTITDKGIEEAKKLKENPEFMEQA